MTKVILRDYQQDSVDDIERKFIKQGQRIILQLNTGAGKTIIAGQILKNATERGLKCGMVSHRVELLIQSHGAMNMFGLSPEILSAKQREIPDGNLVLIMLETIKRRIQMEKEGYLDFIQEFDLLILDEAHLGSYNRLFSHLSRHTNVLGLTATPQRKNNQPPLSEFYSDMISSINTVDLVQQGHLSKSKTFGQSVDLSAVRVTSGDFDARDQEAMYNERMVYDGVVKGYRKHCNGKKALLFASTVDSSIDIMNRFRQAGISSMHVDAGTPKAERELIRQEYADGKYQVLCNCNIYSIGFDDPDTKAIILYKATRSLTLYLQMIGRGARVTTDKNEFIILDYGQNIEHHGWFEQPRNWTLENESPVRRAREERRVKFCPECDSIVPVSTVTCPHCSYVWERTRREQLEEIIEVELKELSGFDIQLYSLGKTFEELEIIRNHQGYQKNWMLHQLTSLEDLAAYGRFMGYAPGWIHYARKSFKPKTREQREQEIEAFKQKIRDEAR